MDIKNRLWAGWRWLEHAHTVHWLAPTSASAALGRFVEGLPWTYSIAAGLVTAAAVSHLFRLSKDKIDPPGTIAVSGETSEKKAELTEAEKSNAFFKNRDVKLHDLIVEDRRVIGRTFEDCFIHGPAVVGFRRSPRIDCKYVAPDAEDLVIAVWENRAFVGTLLIKDCTFRRCTFKNISFLARLEPSDLGQQGLQSPQETTHGR
jgi:hypothetical protein